jgi:hypothetical protein
MLVRSAERLVDARRKKKVGEANIGKCREDKRKMSERGEKKPFASVILLLPYYDSSLYS